MLICRIFVGKIAREIVGELYSIITIYLLSFLKYSDKLPILNSLSCVFFSARPDHFYANMSIRSIWSFFFIESHRGIPLCVRYR